MDKPFYYNVVIEEADIPDNYESIYVEYGVKIDEKNSETFKTQIVSILLYRLKKELGIQFSTIRSCISLKRSMISC